MNPHHREIRREFSDICVRAAHKLSTDEVRDLLDLVQRFMDARARRLAQQAAPLQSPKVAA